MNILYWAWKKNETNENGETKDRAKKKFEIFFQSFLFLNKLAEKMSKIMIHVIIGEPSVFFKPTFPNDKNRLRANRDR